MVRNVALNRERQGMAGVVALNRRGLASRTVRGRFWYGSGWLVATGLHG